MNKDKLKGHYVTYIDKNASYRTHKVIKINGKTLTVSDVLGVRHRIHPKKNQILGRQLRSAKGISQIEVIEWD